MDIANLSSILNNSSCQETALPLFQGSNSSNPNLLVILCSTREQWHLCIKGMLWFRCTQIIPLHILLFLHLSQYVNNETVVRCVFKSEWERPIANLGAAILVCWVKTNVCFRYACLNTCLKNLDNRNKSYNPCEEHGKPFRGKLWEKSVFWKGDFQEKKLINER